MMSLILLLVAAAMISAFAGRKRLSYGIFAIFLVAGLFWFRHHATSNLDILL